MSRRVTVRAGSLDELIRKLQDMRGLIDYRRANGWPPWQPDERWRYESMRDRRVCPVCGGYEARRFLSGPEMATEFKGMALYLGGFEARPNTHLAYPRLRGVCRCRARFENPAETLALRLAGELREIAS